MDYPKGLDPHVSKQHLLFHSFSPSVSLQSSHNVDLYFQSILNNGNDASSISTTLQIFKPFGNNIKYAIPNQQFKITNTQLITKSHDHFPIRFDSSLPEILSVITAQQQDRQQSQQQQQQQQQQKQRRSHDGVSVSSRDSSSSSTSDSLGNIPNFASHDAPQLEQLFRISSLEQYLRHAAKNEQSNEKDLYLTFLDKIITSNRPTAFETFNHPVAQVFVIDYDNDSVDDLRKMMVEFRNYNFPKYFQIDDLLMHVFIVFDSSKYNANELSGFQSNIRSKLNIESTLLAIKSSHDEKGEPEPELETETLSLVENCTIEEHLQRISLNDLTSSFTIPQSVDTSIKFGVNTFINKYLIPHMQNKVRAWDDQVLQPKKSITGRFFSASRKLFNNNSDSNLLSSTSTTSASHSHTSFNHRENQYYKSSPEQITRKLADWSLMLKDYKYAYSTYDIVRKDYSNERAWLYVASTQEMCIVSLLLQHTTNSTVTPDRNTLRRIKHDIIEPYMDNLSYTFKSRFNLKTYSIASFVIVVELLLLMSQTYQQSIWWFDLIEKYLHKLIVDFDTSMSNAPYSVIKALLLERLGYNSGRYFITSGKYSGPDVAMNQANKNNNPPEEQEEEEEEGVYGNKLKLQPTKSSMGSTKFRISALWYLLSMKEWLEAKSKSQIDRLLPNVLDIYQGRTTGEGHGGTRNAAKESELWFNRKEYLLRRIRDV
ncbi:hypothetical protein KGF57_004559 [Candida theae]|uniref:Trafficking protein particle complex III-specific subunit 85 n=1 Tax=Candida theae TaxID=1198502 RepID=A0AAD5BBD0_9ASCO|nr:uncharacterized protein KGF57_004559 [Candida theae]KAI5949736.1 hypothetical protein KGF57_004559 [Candida theae]